MNRNYSATPNYPSHTTRRRCLTLLLALCAAAAYPFALPLQAQVSSASDQLLHRMYASPDFEVKYFGPARWLDDGSAYTTVEPSAAVKDARDIVRYETATGKREVLVSASQLIPPNEKSPLEFENFFLSKDKSKVLLYTNTAQVWRRNTRGDYWVLDLRTKSLRKLGGDAPPSSLMFAKFSPDGSQVAYVRANNIYVENVATGTMTQITRDGSATIVNGTSDWVYEEELDVRDGFRWSPDGRRIAYWQFDTSNVGIFKLLYNLGAPKEIVTGFPYPGLGVYPSVLNIPYPIPGTTNSAVRVGVVSAQGGETKWMAVPGDPRNNYIARMEWAPGGNPAANELVIEHLNRLQNTNDVLLADSSTGAVQQIFRDQDPDWVDINDEIKWVHDGREFLWRSERDGWCHAYLVSRDGKNIQLLTPGAYDVISLDGVDEKNGELYFIASPENATQRYLYRVPLDAAAAKSAAATTPERVSPADAPGTHVYDISPDGHWAFHIYSRADVTPVTDLVELPTHKSTRVLEDNHALRANAAPLLTTPTEFFKVDIGDGVTLDAWMLKPPNFDPHKKYPLLVYVYGEPAAQTVEDVWGDWNFDFHRIVANAGYIVVSFDNRGTPAPKGRAWRKIIYGAIHPVIVKDQSAALKVFLQSHPYADPTRVALWGWSGGGSSTLNLMFRSPDLYKVGMAVAPVPDLRLYDTIYQERYMGLPLQNVEGYRDKLRHKFRRRPERPPPASPRRGDDNVHYSGSELLLNRLIELDKPIDFMEYPNRTHAINEGPGTTLHLYSLLLRYLEEHIPPVATPPQP